MNNQLRLFNEGARQALGAAQSVQFFLLDLLHHVDDRLQQLPPPPGTELDQSFNLQPHNEHIQHLVTIYEFVQTNLSMSEGCKQNIDAWILKFADLLRTSNIDAEVFLHGSVFQGTAITGSDCDISLRFAECQHLEQVLQLLKNNKHQMHLQHWIGIVGKACPTIKCKTGNEISIDITDGRERQQSLCTSYFVRELPAKRPDAAIFIKIVKQYFMHTMFYGGAKQCLGGIAFSVLILRGMQYIGVLPAFGRFDFGEFGNLNAMYEQYWQTNEVQARSADDIKDETLYTRFILILEWIIQTRLTEPISLGPNDQFQNPGVAAVVIFAPPNDYTNVAFLVTIVLKKLELSGTVATAASTRIITFTAETFEADLLFLKLVIVATEYIDHATLLKIIASLESDATLILLGSFDSEGIHSSMSCVTSTFSSTIMLHERLFDTVVGEPFNNALSISFFVKRNNEVVPVDIAFIDKFFNLPLNNVLSISSFQTLLAASASSYDPLTSNLLFVMPPVSKLVQLWECFYQFNDYKKAKFYIHDEDQGKQFIACIETAAATSATSPVSDLTPTASPATNSIEPLSPVDLLPAASPADSTPPFSPAPSSTSQS